MSQLVTYVQAYRVVLDRTSTDSHSLHTVVNVQVSCLSLWLLKLGNRYSCSHARVSKRPPADLAIHLAMLRGVDTFTSFDVARHVRYHMVNKCLRCRAGASAVLLVLHVLCCPVRNTNTPGSFIFSSVSPVLEVRCIYQVTYIQQYITSTLKVGQRWKAKPTVFIICNNDIVVRTIKVEQFKVVVCWLNHVNKPLHRVMVLASNGVCR